MLGQSTGKKLWSVVSAGPVVSEDGSYANQILSGSEYATNKAEALGLAYESFKRQTGTPPNSINAFLLDEPGDLIGGLLGADLTGFPMAEVNGVFGRFALVWKSNEDTVVASVIFRPEDFDSFAKGFVERPRSDDLVSAAKEFLCQIFKAKF